MKKVLLGLLAIITLVYFAGFIIPDKAKMQRDIFIAADREEVFMLIADFDEWQKWSPWAARDPEMEMTLTGTGVGQSMVWTSDAKDVGNGRQTITALTTPEYMASELDFGEMGKATASMTLTEKDGGTVVVWGFDSNMRDGVPLLMRPISAYMAPLMDQFLGPDYEAGLAKLKIVAEAQE